MAVEYSLANERLEMFFSNIVCAFEISNPIDLKVLVTRGLNVMYVPEQNTVKLHLPRPKIYACFWASGKILCTGSQTDEEAIANAKYLCRLLKNLGFKVELKNYRVVNIMGSGELAFGVNLSNFQKMYPDEVTYDSQQHPAATVRFRDLKAQVKVFHSGKMTLLAPNHKIVDIAMERFNNMIVNYIDNTE